MFAPVISRSAATAFVYDARFDELIGGAAGRSCPTSGSGSGSAGPARRRGRSRRARPRRRPDSRAGDHRRRRRPAGPVLHVGHHRAAEGGARTRTPAPWRSPRSCGSTSHSDVRRSSAPDRSSGGSASSPSPRRRWRAESGWCWRRASAPPSSSRPCRGSSITHISVTPSFFAELLSTDAHAEVDLSSLRVAMLGGEPLLPSLQRRILERHARSSGSTATTGRPRRRTACSPAGTRVPDGVVGWARTGGAVRVVDPEGRRVVGDVGEIQLAGPHVMAGYDGQPDATADALRDGLVRRRRPRAAWTPRVGCRCSAVGPTPSPRAGPSRSRCRSRTPPRPLDGVAEAGAVGVPAEGDDQRILLVVTAAPGGRARAGARCKALLADEAARAVAAGSDRRRRRTAARERRLRRARASCCAVSCGSAGGRIWSAPR